MNVYQSLPAEPVFGFSRRATKTKQKQLKGLGTHISPAGPVGTHISQAPDGLRRYSTRPRTSMTRAGGAKGGAGGEAPCQTHPVHGFSKSIWGFSRTIYGFSTTVKLDKSLKIEFWEFRWQKNENGRWEFRIRVIKLFPRSYRI